MGLFNPILGSLTIVDSVQSSGNAPCWLKVRLHCCPAQSSPVTPHNSQDLPPDPAVLPSRPPCCPACCVSITPNLFPLRDFQLSSSFFLQWFCPRPLQEKKKKNLPTFLPLCPSSKIISSETLSLNTCLKYVLPPCFQFIVLIMNWHYIPFFIYHIFLLQKCKPFKRAKVWLVFITVVFPMPWIVSDSTLLLNK